VRYRVTVDSWLPEPLAGVLSYRVTAADGRQLAQGTKRLSILGAHAETIELAPPEYGVYTTSIMLERPDGPDFRAESRFACIPRPHEHTPAEKLASPYGLNVHGGNPGVAYGAIGRIGFTWIRDYAYSREWLIRARGDDGRYAGWPWYPKLDERVRRSGLLLLPCMGQSIAPYVGAGKLQPDKQWKRDLVHVLWAFPQYPAWELDNEYDYHHGNEEIARNWSSYDAYHKTFGELVNLMDQGVLAVEQGTAGVHPDRVRRSVGNGSFDRIDVVNGHFYCGTRPPELSTRNANVGGEASGATLLADNLRELVEASDGDGKDRQTWITEFGWDTLAGHVVGEHEQAAYLQRGYLLQLQAGIDKAFWYWNRDTKDEPDNFFDGCGIFDPRDEPKPAVAAMAAMAHLLKLPRPVGTFDLGPHGLGHVFRDRGRLVACAFKLQEDSPDVEAEFARGELFDMFANPLAARRQTLGVAPVWIVGLPPSDPIVLETAYDLKSRCLARAAAGDSCTIELRARNRRESALRARFAVEAPGTWSVETSGGELAAPPGTTQVVPLGVTIDPREKAGTREVAVTVTEGPVEKRLVTRFLIVPAAEVSTRPLLGPPGRARLQVDVKNHSLEPRSFTLRPELPQSWKVEPPEVQLEDVEGKGTREASFQVEWNANWRPGESARLAVFDAGGERVGSAGIVPGALKVPRVEAIRCDGDLGDWPAGARVPDWATALLGDDPGAAIYLGHSPAGLHLACRVGRSKAAASDPRSFWHHDCLEVFIDSADDKTPRPAYRPTDHQFWLCPVANEHRAYLGRWKRNEEIPETLYDVPGIESSAKRIGGGYVMEALLPAAMIRGFRSQSGRRLGLNLNLTVPGPNGPSEVYWPTGKPGNAPTSPHLWGTVELK